MCDAQKDITSASTVMQAFKAMKAYQNWAENTVQAYTVDVKGYEEFLMDNGEDPTLEKAQSLSYADKWVKSMVNNNVPYKTMQRRVAALSKISSFYKELGIITSNPFKALSLPGRHEGSFSRTLSEEELKNVYCMSYDLDKEGLSAGLTLRVLIFTGLRNQALCSLTVGSVDFETGVIIRKPDVQNSKQKFQILPVPTQLLEELKIHIETYDLQSEDPLLYGLRGEPLQNKQLNRIVDRVCTEFGWDGKDGQRLTPHGFRYTIATLMHERGEEASTIQKLLGHEVSANGMSASIKHYILKSKKDIHLIRKQLNRLETELIEYRLSETQRKTTEQHSVDLPASGPVEPTVASEALAALASAAKNNPALLNAVGQNVQSAIISYWISQGELEAGELA